MLELDAKKILVTGGSGFAGSHLLEYLLENTHHSLFGTYLTRESLENLPDSLKNVNFKKLDLIKEKETSSLIEEIRPDYIFHLAGFASTSKSFHSPWETIGNNMKAQLNLLEAIRKSELFDTSIVVISSADIYGKVTDEELPIKETAELRPSSPYSVSKIGQDFLALQYFNSYGIKTIRLRPFNHIGPRQSPDFVVSSFAKKIAEIEKGKIEPVLSVGNLEPKRDFTNVKDMVKGYWMAMEKGAPGQVYNLGSGVSYKIEEILTMLLSLTEKKISVKQDESLLRPVDNQELRCDSSKFKKLTGWTPEISIEKTLQQTLDYWRNII